MKQRLNKILLPVIVLAACFNGIVLLAGVFAMEKPLKTVEASPSEVKGIFTLVYYGGNYSDDLETIALLDFEGDPYTLEPFAPDFDYRVRKGIPDEKALAAAEKFVGFHPAFWKTQLSKILDGQGNIIGFEVRPLYRPFIFGVSDILDVNYWPKNYGKVKVMIKLIPSVERLKIPAGDGVSGGAN